MWNLINALQIKRDYFLMGNYRMWNRSIIAYLESFLMNVEKKNEPNGKEYSHTKWLKV